MPLSLTQKKTLAFLPKASACMSAIGSACIITSVCKERKRSVYHGLLLGMSVFDMLGNIGFFLSTWPIPKGTPGVWSPAGNTATCTIQGFLIHVSGAAPFYNAALAFYYVLITRLQWSEDRIRSVELYLHAASLAYIVSTAIASIPMELYNNANLWCWIAPFPLRCKDSFTFGDDADCVRGDNSWIYRLAFAYVPIWCCICISTACLLLVYWTVLQQERAVDKFQEEGLSVRTRSKRVAWQAIGYIAALYTSWFFPTLVRLLQTIPQTKGKFYYNLVAMMSFFLPIQGFLNFLNFSRSRYLRYKRENPNANTSEAARYAVFSQTKKSHSTTGCCEGFDPTSELPTNRIVTEDILKSEVLPRNTAKNNDPLGGDGKNRTM